MRTLVARALTVCVRWQAFVMVSGLADFVGKDEVERNLRWAAKNYAERIYKQSYTEN